jgi:hypothetical protein
MVKIDAGNQQKIILIVAKRISAAFIRGALKDHDWFDQFSIKQETGEKLI